MTRAADDAETLGPPEASAVSRTSDASGASTAPPNRRSRDR